MAQPLRMLVGLLLGLLLGTIANASATPRLAPVITAADVIGGMWLDALRMTIIPLVVALLVTGIASGAEAARANRLALRSVLLFLVLLWISCVTGALLMELFTFLWPLDPASGGSLRLALAGVSLPEQPVPSLADFFRGIIPTNPVAAAAGDSLLPLILFTTLFAFAVTQLNDEARIQLTSFFAAVRDAMLVVIGWVLWIGPLGVFALAFVLGARAGSGAMGALIHYVLLVSLVGVVIGLSAYPLAVLFGRMRPAAFAKSLFGPQAVAISTQSSLASLPAMLASCRRLGIPLHVASVVLPLAVTLFRVTSPAMNVAVVLYVAHWLGIEISAFAIAMGIVVAATTTIGSVSLPGQISFFASIAPIAAVMGVPLEPIALLIAVEMIPDIFRTLGNVSMDVAVTAVAARGEDARIDEPVVPAEPTGMQR